MEVRWKTVSGLEAYEVSDQGGVRNKLTGRVLKPRLSNVGRLQVHLYKNGKQFSRLIHRLVAGAFIPNPKNLPQVNHKGEDTDNRACKLEWISTSDHGKDIAKREQYGTGICFDKKRNKWRALYSPETNKRKHIGYFVTRKEAKAARDTKIAAL